MALVLPTSRLYWEGVSLSAMFEGERKVWEPKPWTPASVPGLAVWFDAMADADRFIDGQTIDSYTEWSPAKRQFSTFAGSSPRFHLGGGRPYIELWQPDYGGFYSAASWNPGTAGLTFIVVIETTGGQVPMVIVWGPMADGFEMRHMNTLQAVMQYTTNFIYFSDTASAPYNIDHRFILSVDMAKGSTRLQTDNNPPTFGPAPIVMPNISQYIWVGMREGGYVSLGKLREVLVYSGPLVDADRIQIENYLKTKWQIL